MKTEIPFAPLLDLIESKSVEIDGTWLIDTELLYSTICKLADMTGADFQTELSQSLERTSNWP